MALPNDHVFKGPFFLAELALLFGVSLAPQAGHLFFQLIFRPSLDGLLDFVFTNTFLLSTVVYFASACNAYGAKLQKTEEAIDRHRQEHEELKRLRQWRLEDILKNAGDSDTE